MGWIPNSRLRWDKRVMTTLECYCCTKKTPKIGRRVCPECGLVFGGNGWVGMDRHWRTRHERIMSYEQFRASLCDDHRKERSTP